MWIPGLPGIFVNLWPDHFKYRQEETKRWLDELLQSLLQAKGVEEAVAAIESGDGSFSWLGAVVHSALSPKP
jgi:hypothetical protein